MKRKGFTLAEALIAIAIVGVVTAMTIPNLVANYRKNAWASALSVAVSNFETAMTTMIYKEDVADLSGTKAWIAAGPQVFTTIGIKFNEIDAKDGVFTMKMKNGTVYEFTKQLSDENEKSERDVYNAGGNLRAKLGELTIDVNGADRPNEEGRDIFKYYIGEDGYLFPLYGKDYCAYKSEEYNSPREKCVVNKEMKYCAAYLKENGYKMDY